MPGQGERTGKAGHGSQQNDRLAPQQGSQAAVPGKLRMVQWQDKGTCSAQLLKQVISMERSLFPKHASWADEMLEATRKRSSRLWCAVEEQQQGHVQVVGYLLGSQTTLTLCIQRLAVLPSFRRKGIATWLIQAAAMSALTQRASICLSLHVENPEALALYIKLGFTVDAVVADYHGPGRDSQHMLLQADKAAVLGWSSPCAAT